ncbi:MAG: serine hydrolase domain-containing protein [Cyclobacteriaceae bacterium]
MKTKATFLILLVTSILFVSDVCGQKLNTVKLDSLFDVLSNNNKAMGSVAISKNGKLLYTKSIGFSALFDKMKIPATETTKYRIGSITKTFTTVLIFQLIEEGKLSLTTTLDKYFPSVPNAKSVTISNLLNHRSGIHNFTNDPAYLTWMTKPKTKDEMVAIIAKSPSDFQPDSKAEYSNSNFVLLGFIIEKLRKKPYSEVLAERITKKIGLADTNFGTAADTKRNESYSYKWMTDKWNQEPETDMSIPHGAGAIISTPSDLVRFLESLFAGKLVKPESLLKMKTITDNYGMGLFQFPFDGKKGFGHTGGIDGFASSASYFPDDSLSVAYCTNGQVYPMNDILIGILSIYFDRPYSIPTFKTSSYSVKTEDLDKYLGNYSSQQLPLKITITKNDAVLTAQATGQSSFPLDATEKDRFKFEPAGVVLEFNPEKGEMILKQGGGVFQFTKDK